MALILLTLGIVLAFSIKESLPEEITLGKWDPLTPPTLNPQNETGNETGWDYMELTQGGSFLKLNVTASDNVTLIIGEPTYDNVTGEETWANVVFNQVGTRFAQEVAIAGTAADCLDIKNEGTTPVNISGSVTKIANAYQTVHPELFSGAFAMLLGFILLIYGTLTRPPRARAQKRYSKRKTGKTLTTWGERTLVRVVTK